MLKQMFDHIENLDLYADEPMSEHTSFKIGGKADLFAVPKTEKALKEVLEIASQEKIPFYFIGNGSNLLISDDGYRGVMIGTKELKGIDVREHSILAKAGDTLKEIADQAQRASLTGFEFASGIPGTLGGAVRMNAGAYDGEMKDVIVKARFLTPEGEVLELDAPDLHFDYRHSVMQERPLIFLEAEISLTPGDADTIQAKMDDLNQRRADKQPLDKPSAGSTFRRPAGYFAGKLIQDSGMQGQKVGGAMVSTKHAGFVVNDGGATAKDVIGLIEKVQKAVYDQFGVEMKTEVIRVGFDED